MIKFRIFNLEGFLKTVDGCAGAVYTVGPKGRECNINKNAAAKKELMERFLKGGRYLLLSLDIPEPRDYFKIITYYISNL